MNILIVDDEIITVTTLREQLPWDEIGISNVYTANDVSFAKNVFSSFQIDILLCDIEMPGDSGIDLLKWLRENNNTQVVTILLTCHDEFIYAKNAISLGVFDYSLKPISYIDLTLILKKAVFESNNRTQNQKFEKESLLWSKSKESLIRAFWMDYFNSNKNISSENIEEQNFFDFDNSKYTLLVFKVCDQKYTLNTKDLILLLTESMTSFLQSLNLNFSIFHYRKEYIYLVAWTKEKEATGETIKKIYDNLKKNIYNMHINQINLQVCLDYFTTFESLKKMADSFMTLLEKNNSQKFGVFKKESLNDLSSQLDDMNISLLIEKISDYIQDHLSEEFSRNELAEHVFLNKDYLGRVFKKETGMNLMEYVRMQRLLRAKYLLKNTELSISDISSSVGFNSLSHFSNLFKLTFSMSPNDYRNQ